MLPDDDPLPIETVLTLERDQLVQVALEEIKPRCRQLIELLYLANPPVPYAEVARSMDMPLGAIGPTRARCLNCLRERLLKLGY